MLMIELQSAPGPTDTGQNKQTHGERTALSRRRRCFPSERTWARRRKHVVRHHDLCWADRC